MKVDARRRGGAGELQRSARGSWERWLAPAAFAYPLLLAATCGLFLSVGERHWLPAALLYAPRFAFGAPLLLFAPVLWLKARRLLWTQALALILVVFPLMGLVLPGPRPHAHGKTFRVLSYNVDTGTTRHEQLLRYLEALRPDIVLFQESWSPALCARLRSRYAHVECVSQFAIASRFAILDRTDPEPVQHFGTGKSARFMRYLLDSSLGKLAVYSMHPLSPRGAIRLPGWREVTRRSGGPFWKTESDIENNASLRERQAAAVAALARREQVPVLIAGDTNLPGLSAALHRHFSEYRDGFARASWGFGYTYPARHPFLRLDRMMLGPELDFADFQVGCPDASDHLCIVGDVLRR